MIIKYYKVKNPREGSLFRYLMVNDKGVYTYQETNFGQSPYDREDNWYRTIFRDIKSFQLFYYSLELVELSEKEMDKYILLRELSK